MRFFGIAIAAIIATILLASLVLGAKGYAYIPNIDPHTRYNPLREGCYYYYGYGSCNVTASACNGVAIGQNKWVNLGDACERNEPPKIRMGTLRDIIVNEGEKITITTECIDEDPVNTTYSGWTTTKETITGFADAGTFRETITCTDSFGEKVEGTFKIIIIDNNRNPLFRLVDWAIISPKPIFTGNYTNSTSQ